MDKNQAKNIVHYNRKYKDIAIEETLEKLKNLDKFLSDATQTDTSWVGLYKHGFKDVIKGKKVLELGCGDCVNAAVMAGLGAKVYANDIASTSGEIVKKLNQSYNFENPMVFIEGDFLKVPFEEKDFDFVVGKAFIHHLTLPIEQEFIEKIVRLLKREGEARFFEPAVNNKFLDEIRWHLPVPGRPSKFNRKAFTKWKENDPHPERDNSSKHFRRVGAEFFEEVEIIPLGTLERFHRILPKNANHRKFRRDAFIYEEKLPNNLNSLCARSQVIIYRKPVQ